MAFKYRGGERTAESVIRKSKQSTGGYDSFIDGAIPLYKPKEGENSVRIMPPTWEGEDLDKWGNGWEITVFIHYDVGADGATYLCLDKMLGKACPVCEARSDAVDDEEAREMRPQPRQLAWIIDRDAERSGPQIFSLPGTLFKDINARSVHKKTGAVIQIDNPEEGRDVLFEREGTKLRTKYKAVEVSGEASPISDDDKLYDRWLNYVIDHPLPSVLVFYDYEHIERVLKGKSSSRRQDDDEEDERSARRPSSRSRSDDGEERSSRRSSRREEPEEDERQGRRSSRRSEEDEAPRSSRRSRSGEDDEEDERASRRSRSSSSDEEEEPKKPARRGRLVEDEEEASAPRRSRSSSSDEAEERPARRKVDAEDEGEEVRPPRRRASSEDDDQPTSRRSRSDEEEERPVSRRKPAEADDEEPSRRVKKEEADEEDRPVQRRRRPADEDAKGGGEDEDDPSATAKSRLSRLKSGK